MDVLSPGEQRPGERTDDSGILAVATAIGGVASLVLGRMYDRVEIGSVLLGVVLSALFSAISVFLAAAGRLDAVGSRLRNAGHAFEGANCQCASGGEAEPGVRSLLTGLRRRMESDFSLGWRSGRRNYASTQGRGFVSA